MSAFTIVPPSLRSSASMLRPEASIISSFTFCLAFRQPYRITNSS